MIKAFDMHTEPLRGMFAAAVMAFTSQNAKPVQITHHQFLNLMARFYQLSGFEEYTATDMPEQLAWLMLEGCAYDIQREFYYRLLWHYSMSRGQHLEPGGALEDAYVNLITDKLGTWQPFPAHAFT